MKEKDETLALEVNNIYISYRNVKKISIRRGMHGRKNAAPPDRVDAVKGVSFSLDKGKILGIVGKNGSGKSTLLRGLAGVFSPDSGTVDLKGNSISLLSVGVGFQKEMTGRENVILSGLLLGFSEEFIRSKMDEIIQFADLGRFIDMPVYTYSTGMYSKLAFSITAVLETDIMLVDEVLSVGDQGFRKKSYERMQRLIRDKDRTVIIVSHSLSALEELCDEIMWMQNGEAVMLGKADSVLREYKRYMDKA